MLSKPSALLLGVIAEKPINPYEITKLMEYISVGNWLSLSPSSIYTTIKTLQDKGYIVGKSVKEGNMPEKTVYGITEAGRKQLISAIEAFLGNLEWDYAQANIATILICHLTKERALEILREKIKKLTRKSEALQTALKELNATVPATGLHAMRHMIHLTNTDITSSRELIATIEADTAWNHFLAVDIQNGLAKTKS